MLWVLIFIGLVIDFMVDLFIWVSVDEINVVFKVVVEGRFKGILKYYDVLIVLSDIVIDLYSLIFDFGLIKVIDD